MLTDFLKNTFLSDQSRFVVTPRLTGRPADVQPFPAVD